MSRPADRAGRVHVGVIGVGPIGESVAVALLERGHDVVAFDLRADRLRRVADAGARTAASAVGVATGCDVVFTALPTSDHVAEVVGEGLLGVMSQSVLVDLTTAAPSAQIALSARCADAGVDFLELPVSGRAPQFTAFAGGDARVLDRLAPLLDALTDVRVHVGPVGSGSRAKIVHQLIAFGNFALACEALAIASRAGLPLDTYVAALQRSRAASAMLPLVEMTVLRRDFEDHGGPLAQIAKDMRLVQGLTDELGVDSRWVEVVTEPYVAAERAGWARESAAAVAKVIEGRVGTQIASGSDPDA